MVKGKIVRATSLAVATVGLLAVPGIAGASAGSISDTGYQSNNVIVAKNMMDTSYKTHTNLLVGNVNLQGSSTGDVKVDKNTNAGSASSGAASNASATSTNVMISNPTPTMPAGTMGTGMGGGDTGTISDTGANSTNKIVDTNSSDTHVTTTTNVAAINFNAQESNTGNVSADKNTNVGNVTSGNASNSSYTSTTITVN